MESSKAKVQWLLSLVVLVICQGFCTSVFAQNQGNIYLYNDRNGRPVYNSHVPSEYVGGGYTILNERGQVLEVVPRAKTAAEIAAIEQAAIAAKAAADAKEAQEEADQLLIRLYRTPEEIARKRDNTLGPLNAQIGLLEGNLTKATQALSSAQTVIDNYTKANKEPPAESTARVANAKNDIAGIEAKLTVLRADRVRIMSDADRDSVRLRQLLGIAQQTAAQ